MSDNYANILGSLDGPGETYPPYNQISPYPKFLVVNIYGGYDLTSGKLICITNENQRVAAHRLQIALAQIDIDWQIALHQPEQGRENVGVQFEIKPLERAAPCYKLEIEIYYPPHGIMSLAATELASLEKGIDTLIQVIQLSFEKFGLSIASLWIADWWDASDKTA